MIYVINLEMLPSAYVSFLCVLHVKTFILFSDNMLVAISSGSMILTLCLTIFKKVALILWDSTHVELLQSVHVCMTCCEK